jgi:hypothetical protein
MWVGVEGGGLGGGGGSEECQGSRLGVNLLTRPLMKY